MNVVKCWYYRSQGAGLWNSCRENLESLFGPWRLWSEMCRWICMWWYCNIYPLTSHSRRLEIVPLWLLFINWIRHALNNSLYICRVVLEKKQGVGCRTLPFQLLYIFAYIGNFQRREEVRVWWRHLFYYYDWANEYYDLEWKMKQYMNSRRRSLQERRWWPRWRWWH